MKFIDTQHLKFRHSSKGVSAFYKNNEFLLGCSSILKQNEVLTDEEMLGLARSVLTFETAMRGYPKYEINSPSSKIIDAKELKNDFAPFSKYVSKEIFDNFILNGKWQLGNINQYRTIESLNQRDEFEGFSFLNLNINDHQIHTVCNSGFNYLIFCGTKERNSQKHREQFGEKELHIPNVKAFADKVCKIISAKRYFIQNVEYNNLKTYINKNPIINSNIKMDNHLCDDYFEILKENLLYPSLFVKPEAFSEEQEVRIVFEMTKDYKSPYQFESQYLLKNVACS